MASIKFSKLDKVKKVLLSSNNEFVCVITRMKNMMALVVVKNV